MEDEAILCIEEVKESMQDAMKHLDKEFIKVRAGKASPSMLSGVKVEYYGTLTPIEQTSNINTPDARQIVIQPFDRTQINEIEKAILNSNLGFNPQNEGDMIRINVPPLTEERRLDLVRKAKAVAEDTKVGIRNARRNGNDEVKKLEKDGLPEDIGKKLMDEIQQLTDNYSNKVDTLFEEKEKDILTV
ncbi:MAG: ribosome recycling factor [Bacteroidales bacterium]|jgi:ribosome recycling factor|nr:ribosome recycling factor [Lentimicrobiaceae bacterium]MDG1136079.1 ribosome recycling factor [Bacteroidales bacterium]MDG1900603.1 ribosome recycling factor [Bacteroidales bacterium]MDG2081384.1 ribosome recycling factor [Bacteroidales bacterium]|tara:strand:- start:23022 stop:23585 length:564 start_codon:yes stop_codon:yes gene_type:complete